jgi:hypothetical protein
MLHFSAIGNTEPRATSRRTSRPEAGFATIPTVVPGMRGRFMSTHRSRVLFDRLLQKILCPQLNSSALRKLELPGPRSCAPHSVVEFYDSALYFTDA